MSDDQPLSQEDIDAAMAGLDAGGEETAPSADSPSEGTDAPPPDGAEQASVDDAPPSPAAEAPADAPAEAAADADSGVSFSQDDIDSLLNDAEMLAGAGTPSEQQGSPSEPPDPVEQPAPAQLDSAGRPFDEAAAEMAAAIAGDTQSEPPPPPPPPPDAEPVSLPDWGPPGEGDDALQSIELLKDVGLQVKIELGRSRMLVEDVLRLGEGSVVELDKLAGDPVDVYVNDRLVARGEVLVLNDNFCVRVNEIVSDVYKEFQTA